MPYKRVGKKIMHEKGGKWQVKQTCTSEAKAERALHLLQGVEHGWKPTGKPAKDMRKKAQDTRAKGRR